MTQFLTFGRGFESHRLHHIELVASPERSKFAVRIFVKKSSDFVQQTPPFYGILKTL